MHMKTEPPSARSRASGFTLIELLTVIAVIAILIALLFPALSSVREAARRTTAHHDLVQLVGAVNAYYTEYGQYPLNSVNESAGTYGWDTVYGDPNGLYSSADLCDILRAVPDNRFNQNDQINPRGVVYFQAPNVKNPGNPVSGIATQQTTAPEGTILPGAYLDPWGNEYVVFVDAANFGNVNQALGWFYYVNTPAVSSGVAACSLGKDHCWGTAKSGVGDGKFEGSDDVATWQ